jgi:hypothetical protein
MKDGSNSSTTVVDNFGGVIAICINNGNGKRSLCKKAKIDSGIRICRIARIQAFSFLIRAIRKIRIPKGFFLFGSGSSGLGLLLFRMNPFKIQIKRWNQKRFPTGVASGMTFSCSLKNLHFHGSGRQIRRGAGVIG